MIDIDRIAIEAIEERIKKPISEISTGNETMFVSSSLMATVKALSVLKKEYEEKLRFIPVEETLPPIDIPVILKFKDFQGSEMYQIYTLGSVERREHFLKTHLKFTEWRSFL